jgi:E3 ubiquitin-protein ligase HERC2
VRGIAIGSYHCAALTAEGALYTWSSWEGGPVPFRLGYEVDDDDLFTAMTPRRVEGALDGVRVRSVAAGSDYTVVATQEGELFTFGNKRWGCLGDPELEDAVLPHRIQVLSPARGQAVKEVAAGRMGALALTTQGEVYSWEDDQCPHLVDALHGTRVTHIAAGEWPFAAVSEAGELFTWGDDEGSGCLGYPVSGSCWDRTPTRVEALAETKIACVSAGDGQTLAVALDGTVRAFGYTNRGALGIPQQIHSDAEQRSVPRQVAALRLLQ